MSVADEQVPVRDELDEKVTRVFAGKVVRKDLVRKVKVGANVPVFVLEYLLGKYCASSDEMAIRMGMEVVNKTLADNYIRPDESMRAQSKVERQGPLHVHRQGEGASRRLTLLGRRHQLRTQVRPRACALRRGVRPPSDRRHLGADRHALRVRRGGEGQEPVLDRHADADPARDVRPRRVPEAPGRVHDGRVARPDGQEHGLRAVSDGSAAQAALPRSPDPAVRAELQPCRARPARHRQELRRAGAVAVHRAADGTDDGREPLRAHERPRQGDGGDLGRRRVRRDRRPAEDAARGHHDAQDVLRVRAVPAWP